jgi:tetratricopeptide (TPR) repeat protein
MPCKHLVFILSFLLILSGCSFLPNELNTAEQLIETAPDSALKILKNIYNEESLSPAERARYGLLLFEALDKNDLALNPDTAINFSINYFAKKGDEAHLSKSYFYKARMYKYAQQYEDASLLYLKSLDISKNSTDYNLLAKIYSDLGDISVFQNENIQAREKYETAISFFKKAKMDLQANYKLLDICKTYIKEGNFSKAKNIYFEVLNNSNDSNLIGSTYQGLGINFFYAKQFDSSQVYLKKSLNYPSKGDNYAIRCYKLADAYYFTANYDSAAKYAQNSLKYEATYFTKKECYRILSNVSYLKGDFKMMAEYMTAYQASSDSVRKIETQTKSSIIENIHETSASMSKTRRMLIITGSFLPVIILIGLVIYFRLRRRNRGNQEKIEEQVARIDDYQEQLQHKNELLKETLKQKIADTRLMQAERYKKATIPQREAIDKEVYNTCLHVDDWKKFSTLMNHTFDNLIINLEQEHPDISRKEVIMCCLYLLDIPSNDLALILDYQQVSLYKLKQRLTQKMNFKSTKDLNNYLKQLAAVK